MLLCESHACLCKRRSPLICWPFPISRKSRTLIRYLAFHEERFIIPAHDFYEYQNWQGHAWLEVRLRAQSAELERLLQYFINPLMPPFYRLPAECSPFFTSLNRHKEPRLYFLRSVQYKCVYFIFSASGGNFKMFLVVCRKGFSHLSRGAGASKLEK